MGDFRIAKVLVWTATITTTTTTTTTSAWVPVSSSRIRPRHAKPTSTSLAYEQDDSTPQSSSSSMFNPPSRYLRWNSDSDTSSSWSLQTAVTPYRRKDGACVDVHAMVHLGEAGYFEYYNSRTFNTRYDKVLYELLVDQDLLTACNENGDEDDSALAYLEPTRQGDSPIRASPQDRATAQTYGWSCQADVIHFAQSPDWIHADWTSQELNYNNNNAQSNRIRRAAAPQPATQAVTALLMGPPLQLATAGSTTTATDAASFSQRRLFSTLSVPGSSAWATSLAYALRTILWLTVPCPELSILLVDWSTLLLMTSTTTSTNNVASNSSKNRGSLAGVSPLTTPLLQALWSGHWQSVRQILFGQVVLGRQMVAERDPVLVTGRNRKALQVLETTTQQSLQEQQKSKSKNNKVALLYGCSHGRDMHQQLLQAGYQVAGPTTWRTAWTVRPPPSVSRTTSTTAAASTTAEDSTAPSTNTTNLTTLLTALALPVYLALGGWDWVVTWNDLATGITTSEGVDAATAAGLYLVRHVYLYVVLSQFVLDWNDDAVRVGGKSS